MMTKRTFFRNTIVAGVIGFAPFAVLADDVNCPPDLGDVEIDGNVLIAAPCTMTGTVVKGNVHLYAGGSLVARDISVDGNIQAENAFEVDVAGSEIGGSIQLDDLVGDVTRITDNSVDGNIQLKGNRPRLEVAGNTVNADIQAFSNSGSIDISDNVVDGNLQCKSNDPAPTGGNNTVQGNKEDQCASLEAASGAPGSSSSSSGSGGPAGATASGASAESNSSGGGSLGWLELAFALALLALAGSGRLRRGPHTAAGMRSKH